MPEPANTTNSRSELSSNIIPYTYPFSFIRSPLNNPNDFSLLPLGPRRHTIRVKGDNLIHICRVLYQLSKDPKNDKLFADDEELCGRMVCLLSELRLSAVQTSVEQDDLERECSRVELSAHLEALLYLTGALKFLTASPATGDIFCQETTARALMVIHADLEADSAEMDARISLSGASQAPHSMVSCNELAK
ncbi:unnamed protein product, partial [Dibothriocephalus latus]